MKSIKFVLIASVFMFATSVVNVFAVENSNGPESDDTNVTPVITLVGNETDGPEGDDTNVTPTTTPAGNETDGPEGDDTNVDEEITTPTTTPTEETPSDNSSSRRSGGSRRTTPAPQGEVLGAFTGEESCSTMYLTTYMRQGMANNVDEVKKLQTFLNEHMSAGLPVTGFFGPLTHQAVMNFQVKYTKEVLTPWGITLPTGYVFKTTRALINNLKCANSEKTPVIN